MIVNKINKNVNFGIKVSDKIRENLEKEKTEIILNYGINSREADEFNKKSEVIKRVLPEFYLDCYDDYLINDDALVMTVSNKNKREIYNNNNDFKKYGNSICIDSVYDFILKFLSDTVRKTY